jgi:hypothetical protein
MRGVEVQLYENDTIERKLRVDGNYTLLLISNQNMSNCSFNISPSHLIMTQPNRILIITFIFVILAILIATMVIFWRARRKVVFMK